MEKLIKDKILYIMLIIAAVIGGLYGTWHFASLAIESHNELVQKKAELETKQAKLANDENILKELMNIQMQFIHEHLLILLTALTDKMKIYEQGKRFYYPLALFMIEFIKADYDYISELLNS